MSTSRLTLCRQVSRLIYSKEDSDGRYVKEPNPESLNYMDMAFRWACHDSHGLSNSFSHALKWAGIDLWAEDRKWAAKQKEQSE